MLRTPSVTSTVRPFFLAFRNAVVRRAHPVLDRERGPLRKLDAHEAGVVSRHRVLKRKAELLVVRPVDSLGRPVEARVDVEADPLNVAARLALPQHAYKGRIRRLAAGRPRLVAPM